MKIIKYKILTHVNHGTEKAPVWKDELYPVEIHCSADNLTANEAIAQRESYNDEYTVEDDGTGETAQPTQLDIIEAQVTYTAMMTDTLLEG